MSNTNSASTLSTLPKFYRELTKAMETISKALGYDIPSTLERMSIWPAPVIQEVYMQMWHAGRGDAALPTTDDVRTFVAFMRDATAAPSIVEV